MKHFYFKKELLLLFILVIGYRSTINAQPIPTPGVNTEICPSNSNTISYFNIRFDFGGNSASNYNIDAPSVKGCTVITNINSSGQAILVFSDKKETHQFKIYNSTIGAIVGTYTFTKIKTLDGIKAAITPPPIAPTGYDDALPVSLVGQCKTTKFTYNSPPVKYKDASGVEFGLAMLNYEWVVPKGWKVFTSVSDGVTPIKSSIFAEITPDPLTTGEFKVRADNDCNPFALLPSTWFKVYLNRQAVSLNLISDITAIQCGTQPPVTFSIPNGPLITCANSSYTWNIGPGWLLPNGTAAPSTYSTGITNSLKLIPSCGKALGSVSATVNVAGFNYSVNPISISISQTAFSITGNTSLCSGSAPYVINGLLCNPIFSWVAPPSNIATLSSLVTSPTTLTYAGIGGKFDLTANVTACGVTTPVILPVHIGPYSPSDFPMSWNNGTSAYYCLNQTITFTLSGPPGSNYNWTWPSGWSLVSGGSTSIILRSPPSTSYPPTGSVGVSFIDPCGATINKYYQVVYDSRNCSTGSPYSISPNPASTSITIACISLQTYCNIAQVQITDLYGMVKSSQSWSTTNQQVQMPVSFLPNGTYVAKIYSGTQWYSNTFIVLH